MKGLDLKIATEQNALMAKARPQVHGHYELEP
jgi:hypothetical protein